MTVRRLILVTLLALAARAQDSLNGAGATFPDPLYQKWIRSFAEKFPAQITYRPIGSTAGIAALHKGEVDFAASDAPLTDQQMAAFQPPVHQIPTVVGGVVPIYHLDGVVRDLRFTPEMLAGIYLGKIRRWDDPLIKAANRGVGLPSSEIAVVHRADGSGTTAIWTDYLSKVSDQWRASVGSGTEVHWPAGAGAKGSEGVADLVAKTPNSIGYVEFIYALQAHLSYGAVRNASGRFVQASLSSLAAAADAVTPARPGDLRVSITNAPGSNSYPIAAFTYILFPASFSTPGKGKLMSAFLNWVLTSGQNESAALGFPALPAATVRRALDSLPGAPAGGANTR